MMSSSSSSLTNEHSSLQDKRATSTQQHQSILQIFCYTETPRLQWQLHQHMLLVQCPSQLLRKSTPVAARNLVPAGQSQAAHRPMAGDSSSSSSSSEHSRQQQLSSHCQQRQSSTASSAQALCQ
jgi:hypothetical protein